MLLLPLCAELVTDSQPSSAPTLREIWAEAWKCVSWSARITCSKDTSYSSRTLRGYSPALWVEQEQGRVFSFGRVAWLSLLR